jgi:hypothetical protein
LQLKNHITFTSLSHHIPPFTHLSQSINQSINRNGS